MNGQEQLYNTMSRAGGIGIASGVVVLVTGIAAGILMIVSGARLLLRRKSINL